MILRPYQRKAVDEVLAAFAAAVGSVLLMMPTGAGKTATVAVLLMRAVAAGVRCIFVAHLDTLVEDTAARLRAAGVHVGFVQAGRVSDPTAPVQVCSLQTLVSRGERPPAELVVVDECHIAQSASARAVLDGYPRASFLGLTATPQRGDGRPLGDVFRKLIAGPSVRELTAMGHLVPSHVLAPGSGYQTKGLAADPLASYVEHAPGTRAIVFAANVAHAEELTARFRGEGGIATELVTGDTARSVRAGLRDRIRSGETKVLVSVNVFVAGWDEPSVETVVIARRMSVTGPYLQGIGRGLRPSPSTGKTRCTVLDLAGCVYMHGLPDEDRVWSLEGRAVRRVEALMALQKCRACLAIYRPAAVCPRCGARSLPQTRVPRVLSRGERLENLSQLPQTQRDAMYLASLVRVAEERIGLGSRAGAWALKQFRQRFGREPEGVTT